MTYETRKRLNNVLKEVLFQVKDKGKKEEIKKEFTELLLIVEKKTAKYK